ncbi:MAG: hypothetical protein ACRDZ2_07385, partial [Ilumatobacteraceae bacterium]
RQGRAERSRRLVLGEHPRRPVDEQGSTGRERCGDGRDLATEVVADQRLQLEAAQPGAAVVGVDDDYFLPDALRAP